MSLRSFHIFFILLSATGCAALATWSIHRGADGGATWLTGVAVAGFLALAPYLRWFVRTYKVAA